MKLVNLSLTAILSVVFLVSTAAGNGFYGNMSIVPTPTDGGIREDIPTKYKEKYAVWKTELLGTEIGRRQWETYANNKQFVLYIKVSKEKGKGAGTDNFKWDEEGRLVGATITLGSGIEDGYPSAIYYPVLNSLAADPAKPINGNILAATKISHEIGHVIQTEAAKMKLLQLQSELVPTYTSIFLSNGFNVQDEKLVELAEKIGGTPIEIWESREYWSEVNAMKFLLEKIKDEPFFCDVVSRIRHNVDTYAKPYSERFDEACKVCGK